MVKNIKSLEQGVIYFKRISGVGGGAESAFNLRINMSQLLGAVGGQTACIFLRTSSLVLVQKCSVSLGSISAHRSAFPFS